MPVLAISMTADNRAEVGNRRDRPVFPAPLPPDVPGAHPV